ncbi:ROK family protein [Alkalimarinus alittae]|uniref:ROK family protein n=1 Tax=Alkalimarinus alittae TaxID=2961619 RepID=A0ABY6MYW6_9ALTE|nr:ROK family protein [Alkalimarinus alittae]UZE94990.1 ROK family protein [Alkalimarinus alittae]
MRFGIDLGGTKIELIALANNNQEVYRKRLPTPKNAYVETLNTITQLVADAESTLSVTGSLGIGIPGTLSPDHGLVKNANSTCLIGQKLKEDLQVRLSREVRIANDADCFTLSEACDGAASADNIVFGVILGTGVGGGITINKSLLHGPNAITGEWGHNPLPWPQTHDRPLPPCYCGKQGCIETYLSGPGFKHSYQALSGNSLSPVEIMSRYNQDPHATLAFSYYTDRLARSLATVINILDPDVIALGGGMSNIDAIYPQVEKQWLSYVFSDKVNTRLVKAQHGDSSGVRGAAWLWGEDE